MQTGNLITTPFGRRSMSLGQLKTQAQAQDIEAGKTADKWQLYRWLCEGKGIIGVGDRSLAVLNALLSFYPIDGAVGGQRPGGVSLQRAAVMRAHGMANADLAPAFGGPGRMRSDHRARTAPTASATPARAGAGRSTDAFGFSLAPLLARAEEFAAGGRAACGRTPGP